TGATVHRISAHLLGGGSLAGCPDLLVPQESQQQLGMDPDHECQQAWQPHAGLGDIGGLCLPCRLGTECTMCYNAAQADAFAFGCG
ncbi:MAG: hypothetical protein R6X16_11395, partial [Anaerolineae bacterium]